MMGFSKLIIGETVFCILKDISRWDLSLAVGCKPSNASNLLLYCTLYYRYLTNREIVKR